MSAKSVSHTHLVTKGSMKLAHNLDDRQERTALHSEDSEVDKTARAAAVAKRFKNLGWINSYLQADKKEDK